MEPYGTLNQKVPLLNFFKDFEKLPNYSPDRRGLNIYGRDNITNPLNLRFHHEACQIWHFRQIGERFFDMEMKAAGEKDGEKFRDVDENAVKALRKMELGKPVPSS